MKISDFHDILKDFYLQKNLDKGARVTFIWLLEEIGELAHIKFKRYR